MVAHEHLKCAHCAKFATVHKLNDNMTSCREMLSCNGGPKKETLFKLASKNHRLQSMDCGLSTGYKTCTMDYGLRTGYKTWTTDYVLGIKHRLRYKTWTTDYGLGIKHRLRYKTWTMDYGLGIKDRLRTMDYRLGIKLQ